MEQKEEKGILTRFTDWVNSLTMKSLLGMVLLAFIVMILLMSISFVPSVMSRISSSLSAALYSIFIPAENATMSIDKRVVDSGEDFTINFKQGDKSANGFFTVTYACDGGVTLSAVTGSTTKTIGCDVPYYLLENNSSLKIRAITTEEVVRLVIQGDFENNSTEKSETIGVVRLTIKNQNTGANTQTSSAVANTNTGANTNTSNSNTNTPTYNTTYAGYTYYGKADLAVRILQTGLLQNGNDLTTNQNQFYAQDMMGVKFEIRNDGDANTGPWNFTAVLPSASTPTYNSNTQTSLKPGDSIIFTLGFSNLTNKKIGTISINADPQNRVIESAEYNNIASTNITNLGNNNYYNNNYNNNGCYINGYFTYNCNNNGYYDNYGNFIPYNNYRNYYNDLSVTCYAQPYDPETGDRVRWYANASGGDGDYSYSWTGTNSFDSSSRNPSKTYSTRGWKYATVTVTDGDDNEISTTCSVYVN
jgi:hypothetical protein